MSQEKENRQHENAQSVQEGQQPHKRRVRYKGRYCNLTEYMTKRTF